MIVLIAQGYHGDTSRMYGVGKITDQAQHLCDATLEALEAAISQCGPNVPVRRIGEVLSLSTGGAVDLQAQRHLCSPWENGQRTLSPVTAMAWKAPT